MVGVRETRDQTLAYQDRPHGLFALFQKWIECGYFVCNCLYQENISCNAGKWSNLIHPSGQ
jgi:hypothetical protein